MWAVHGLSHRILGLTMQLCKRGAHFCFVMGKLPIIWCQCFVKGPGLYQRWLWATQNKSCWLAHHSALMCGHWALPNGMWTLLCGEAPYPVGKCALLSCIFIKCIQKLCLIKVPRPICRKALKTKRLSSTLLEFGTVFRSRHEGVPNKAGCKLGPLGNDCS